jgi:hypothetical protein
VASVLETESVRCEGEAEQRVGGSAAWEPVELPPLPERDARLVAEHHGKGSWGSEAEPDGAQAHLECGSRHAAQTFAKELASEGYDVHQSESFVFVFADDGAAARKLGDALKERAPVDAQLFVEGKGGRSSSSDALPRPAIGLRPGSSRSRNRSSVASAREPEKARRSPRA